MHDICNIYIYIYIYNVYVCIYIHVCVYVYVGTVLKPLSVSLYKAEIDPLKVCKTLARERCVKAVQKRCEWELLSELYCVLR